ncbi:hypothetical protein [Actinocrispum sp. NPDC049592]|uniref:hypothetical protein n=1 Tax=Actinocrispum sp. NPDC049592 TaxID=3154835 RepID=UPI0034209E4A
MPDDDIFDHPDLAGPEWAAAQRKALRKDRWRRNRSRFVWVGITAVVVAVGVTLYIKAPKAQSHAQSPPPPPTSTAPQPVKGFEYKTTDPFARTPAQAWPDGEAGLTMPAAAPLNGFPAKRVGEVLGIARSAIAASRLDRQAAQQDKSDAFQALLAPDSRKTVTDDPIFRTRIKPGFELLDVPPKVQGRLTVEPGRKGELRIHAEYVVAYAFRPPHPETVLDPTEFVSYLRIDQRFSFAEGPGWAPGSRGLYLGDLHTYAVAVSCSAMRDDLLAPSGGDRATTAPPHELTEVIDLGRPMPDTGNCPV